MVGPRTVVGIGPTGIDIVLRMNREEEGVGLEALYWGLGGTIRNICTNLAVLDVPTTLVTQNDGLLPSLHSKSTAREKLRIVRLPSDGDGWFGKYVAITDAYGEVVYTLADYQFAAEAFSRETYLIFEVVDCSALVLTSSDIAEGLWTKLSPSIADGTRIKTCLVTAGLPLPREYESWIQRADLIFMNESEATSLGLTPEEICEMACEHGTAWVFVTLGPRGVFFGGSGGRKPRRREPMRVSRSPVSVVGCGDAFVAGVLRGIVLDWSIDDCVTLGLRASAEVAGSAATTLPEGWPHRSC